MTLTILNDVVVRLYLEIMVLERAEWQPNSVLKIRFLSGIRSEARESWVSGWGQLEALLWQGTPSSATAGQWGGGKVGGGVTHKFFQRVEQLVLLGPARPVVSK